MLNRDQAVEKARQTNDPQDWITATTLKNTCTRILRKEKYNSIEDKFVQCEVGKDIISIWKNIKGYLGLSGRSGAPTELTDPATGQLTEIQNHYYIEKIQKIRPKLPSQGNPNSNFTKHYERKGTNTNIWL